MGESTETAVLMVSSRLREWIHDVNNALFIAKEYLEEIQSEVTSGNVRNPQFDHEAFADLVSTVARNVGRIEQNLQQLRMYAKEELFEQAGVEKPKSISGA